MKTCPVAIREELEARFDSTLESSSGILLYRVSPQRANFLYRWSRFLKDEAALESVLIYDPGDSLYGRGMYWTVRFQVVAPGILFTRQEELELTDHQILINAAYLDNEVILTKDSEQDAKHYIPQLLSKRNAIRKRGQSQEPKVSYPEIDQLLIFTEENRVIVRSPAHPGNVVEFLTPEELARILSPMSSGKGPSTDK